MDLALPIALTVLRVAAFLAAPLSLLVAALRWEPAWIWATASFAGLYILSSWAFFAEAHRHARSG